MSGALNTESYAYLIVCPFARTGASVQLTGSQPWQISVPDYLFATGANAWYLEPKVQFLERSSYLGRKSVHPLALLESNDHVRSPLFQRNLGHDLLHGERVRQTADDVVEDRLYLHSYPRSSVVFKKAILSYLNFNPNYNPNVT